MNSTWKQCKCHANIMQIQWKHNANAMQMQCECKCNSNVMQIWSGGVVNAMKILCECNVNYSL